MKVSENGIVRDMTPEEEQQFLENNKTDKISQLKSLLVETDYKAIKYAEGWLTEEEYEPIKQQRQEWREEINNLENATQE